MNKLYWIVLVINLLFAINYLLQTIMLAKDYIGNKELVQNLPFMTLIHLLLALFFGGVAATAFYTKQYGGDVRMAISISMIPFVLVSIFAVVVLGVYIFNSTYK